MVFCVGISWVNDQKYENIQQFHTDWLASLRRWYYFRLCFSFSCSAISHKDYWDALYFHQKVLKKRFTWSKKPRIFPAPWFNVVLSLEKLCQAVVARNEHSNLQPTLNKDARGASLKVLVNDCCYDLTVIKKSQTLNCYSFLQKFLLKTQIYKLAVGNCGSSIYN